MQKTKRRKRKRRVLVAVACTGLVRGEGGKGERACWAVAQERSFQTFLQVNMAEAYECVVLLWDFFHPFFYSSSLPFCFLPPFNNTHYTIPSSLFFFFHMQKWKRPSSGGRLSSGSRGKSPSPFSSPSFFLSLLSLSPSLSLFLSFSFSLYDADICWLGATTPWVWHDSVSWPKKASVSTRTSPMRRTLSNKWRGVAGTSTTSLLPSSSSRNTGPCARATTCQRRSVSCLRRLSELRMRES